MRTPRRLLFPARASAPLAAGLTLAIAVGLATLGPPGTASAAAPHGSLPGAAGPATATAGTAPAGPAVTSACGTPAPGRVSCFALRRTDVAPGSGVRPMDAAPAGYGPTELRSAYRLPGDGGAGATVAIVDAYDDPTAEADLVVYRQQFGLPACTTANGCFRKVDQRGGSAYPGASPDWAGEISLDLDMVSAGAPAAHILLVEADSDRYADIAAAVDTAVALGANVVSNSYGTWYTSTPGSGEPPTEVTDLDPHYDHPGVAMVVSSGDSGYGVAYPAASPHVTAVGGTSLSRADNARGWSETVWHNTYGGPGSGCSVYEPKPSFQTDTGCPMRTVADVAAVADPLTGVAVYQTYGHTGWAEYGGTSVGAPLIASVYAVAGTPVADSYPNAYPYARPDAFNDVTSGTNGICTPAYLCTAGAGYDGPTGMGTPAGVSAFASGPYGHLSGTVTDAATGVPLAGATVAAGVGRAASDAKGHYTLAVPAGDYQATVRAYGYRPRTSGVRIADGASATLDVTLTPVPSATVSGVVRDGSGQGWPLYARITVPGAPGGAVFTDPVTGRYRISLPQDESYLLRVVPVYTGYQAVDHQVTVPLGSSRLTTDIRVPVDGLACTTPGYTVHRAGSSQTFDTGTRPDGWSVAGTAPGWIFDDPVRRGNNTGGSGGFAIVDTNGAGWVAQDAVLTAPAADLSGLGNPTIGFDSQYLGYTDQTANVDVSADGGVTWATVWQRTTEWSRQGFHVDIPLPASYAVPGVLVRFHFTSAQFGDWWEVDNVTIGNRTCDPVPGGLVVGQTTDANTGLAVNRAAVTVGAGAAAAHATSAATPDDPARGDGFYWVFAAASHHQPISADHVLYHTATGQVTVVPRSTVRVDLALPAGRLAVGPATVDRTVPWGGRARAKVMIKNTGTAPVTVTLDERPGGAASLPTQGGAPLREVRGTYRPEAHAGLAESPQTTSTPRAAPPVAATADAPWTWLPSLPTGTQGNAAAAYNGKVYSVYGYAGFLGYTNRLYIYDTATGTWGEGASGPSYHREAAVGAFIGGRFYVVGGWWDASLQIYDPASDTWRTGAGISGAYAGLGAAVLDGKLYTVGGCATTCDSTLVHAYDPASDSWRMAAPYPEPVSWASCGAIAGKLYCTGGTTNTTASRHTWAYDPGSNTWSARADLPIDLWGSVYTAANGLLLVSGGITGNSTVLTNRGFAYDPVTDIWNALPNANSTAYMAGSACGLYRIGGKPGLGTWPYETPPTGAFEMLPGFSDCASNADVGWLSTRPRTVTLKPGQRVTVTVTVDASGAAVTGPGRYTAVLAAIADTPYPGTSLPVTMTVRPPRPGIPPTGGARKPG